jgi:hypothetical protein
MSHEIAKVQQLMGAARLMRTAFEGKSLEPIAQSLLSRLQCNHADAVAAMDLSVLFELSGDVELALEFQESALSHQQVYRNQDDTNPSSIKVLAIKSRGVIMDNMPLEFLLEHDSVQLESLYVGRGIPVPDALPEHDVAVVAICESDRNQSVLIELEDALSYWPKPVINHPSAIKNLSRERLGPVLQGTPGLLFAASVRRSRHELDALEDLASLGCLPNTTGWIIRPANSHAGHGLERVEDATELAHYLARETGDTFLIAPFVPYQSRDGIYRKFRIALINGQSFPVHMALSQRWMVHYLNADMLDNADHRDEEARFMQDYPNCFGDRHRSTLHQLSVRIGLDYVVLDCAETQDGDLLLFEADNGAVVHDMDPIGLFPYKRPAMRSVFEAFRQMLIANTNVRADSRRVA